MGGDIQVKSEFGKGTSFFIEFRTKAQVLKQDLKEFEIKGFKLDKILLGADLNYEKNGADLIDNH